MNKSQIAFAGLGLILLVGLFLAFKPAAPTPAAAVIAATVAPSESGSRVAGPTDAQPSVVRFEFVVRNGKVVQGPERLSVPKGSKVALMVSSDANDSLHLHGYDLSLQIAANQPATLEFEASIAGRFELELHHSHLELGALEVMP